MGEERNGKARGYGVVKFPSRSQANRAIREMNETDLDGRNVIVRLDRE